MKDQSEKFEAWAIIELMGHQRIAGRVSEMTLGSNSMLRVDVPETDQQPEFSRIFNPSALYAINPVTEEFARMTAEKIIAKPVMEWDMQRAISKMVEQQVNNTLALNAVIEEDQKENDPF